MDYKFYSFPSTTNTAAATITFLGTGPSHRGRSTQPNFVLRTALHLEYVLILEGTAQKHKSHTYHRGRCRRTVFTNSFIDFSCPDALLLRNGNKNTSQICFLPVFSEHFPFFSRMRRNDRSAPNACVYTLGLRSYSFARFALSAPNVGANNFDSVQSRCRGVK